MASWSGKGKMGLTVQARRRDVINSIVAPSIKNEVEGSGTLYIAQVFDISEPAMKNALPFGLAAAETYSIVSTPN